MLCSKEPRGAFPAFQIPTNPIRGHLFAISGLTFKFNSSRVQPQAPGHALHSDSNFTVSIMSRLHPTAREVSETALHCIHVHISLGLDWFGRPDRIQENPQKHSAATRCHAQTELRRVREADAAPTALQLDVADDCPEISNAKKRARLIKADVMLAACGEENAEGGRFRVSPGHDTRQ